MSPPWGGCPGSSQHTSTDPQPFGLGTGACRAPPVAPAGAPPAGAQDPGALAPILHPPAQEGIQALSCQTPSLRGEPSLPFLPPVPAPPSHHHQPANIKNNPCNSLCFYSLVFLAPALLISAPPAPKRLLKLPESGDLCKHAAPGCPCCPLPCPHPRRGWQHPCAPRGAGCRPPPRLQRRQAGLD